MSHSTIKAPLYSSESGGSARWHESVLACVGRFSLPANEARSLYFYLQGSHAALEGATELISRDPILAVEVIRSSNSAVYGSRGARSLQDALHAIGMERLGRIALRIWLRNLMPHDLTAYKIDGGDFLLRAVACGAAMRFLYQGDSELAETAYAIGLLHSIGRVVLDGTMRTCFDVEMAFEESTARRIADAETLEFGINHAEVGSHALRTWGFSKLVYGPIGRQFSLTPTVDENDWSQSLAICRFVSDRVLEALRGGSDSMGAEGRAIYRGRPLSDLFEYTLMTVEQESSFALN